MRDSIVLYRSIYDAMKKAKTAELRSKIIMAIMAYGFDGEEYADDDPTVSIVFDLIKPQIDANNRRYENGKRGGRPKKSDQKTNETQENHKNQVGYLETEEKPNDNQEITKPKPNNNQTITKVEPNVHVHVNVNDNVHDNVHEDIIIPPIRNTTYCCSPHGGNDGQDMLIHEVQTEPSDEQPCYEHEERKKKVPRKKKETDGAEDAEVLTWRNDFQTYLQECRDAWKRWVNDPQWMEERRKFNPGVDILLTLEKACKEFWATEAGWAHKKRQRSKNIDWKRTFEAAISNKNNRVYEQRNSSNGSQAGGSIEDALRAAADGIRRARTQQPWESVSQPIEGAEGVGWANPGFGR